MELFFCYDDVFVFYGGIWDHVFAILLSLDGWCTAMYNRDGWSDGWEGVFGLAF